MVSVNLLKNSNMLQILFKDLPKGSYYSTWINYEIGLLFSNTSLELVGIEVSFNDIDYASVINAIKGDLDISDDVLHNLMHEASMKSMSLNGVVKKILEDRFAPVTNVAEKVQKTTICSVCKGTGYMQFPGGRQCDQCGGSGKWNVQIPEEGKILISENIKNNKTLAEAIKQSREDFLNGKFTPSQRSMTTPCGSRPDQTNVGTPWKFEEDSQLVHEYCNNKLTFKAMAIIHKRTEGAIKSRLIKLGYTKWDSITHRYVPNYHNKLLTTFNFEE